MENERRPIQTGIKGISFVTLISPGISKYLKLERTVNDVVVVVDFLPQTAIHKSEGKLDKTGIKKEASKCIREFETTLKHEKLYLGNFYRNMRPYCVETIKARNAGVKEPGYDPKTKKLTVIEGEERNTIFRSLFDCASSNDFDPMTQATGFHRIKYTEDKDGTLQSEYDIGKGLNIAYREILLERYFKDKVKIEDYALIKSLALLIELIVGREKMEHSYLMGDIGDVIENLPHSYKGSQILRIMDYLYLSIYQNNGALARAKASEYYRTALLELAKMFIIRIKRDSPFCIGEEVTEEDLKLFRTIIATKYVNYGQIIGISDEEVDSINRKLCNALRYGDTYIIIPIYIKNRRFK